MRPGPPRRSSIALVIAVIGGAATILLDLGWVAWCACLALAALAVLLATPLLAHRVTGVRAAGTWLGAVVLAAAVVFAGIVAVRPQPLSAPGWALDAERVVVVGDTVVGLRRGRILGHRLDGGRFLWAAESGGADDVLAIGGRVLLAGNGFLIGADPADGRRRWRAEIGTGGPRASDGERVVTDEPAQATDLATGRTAWRAAAESETGVYDFGAEFADRPLRADLGAAARSPLVLTLDEDRDRYAVRRTSDGGLVRRLGALGDAGLLTVAGVVVEGSEVDGTVTVSGDGWTRTITDTLDGGQLGLVGDRVRVLRETGGRQSAVLLDPRDGSVARTTTVPAGWRLGETSPIVIGNPGQLPVERGGRAAVWDVASGRLALAGPAAGLDLGSFTDTWSLWRRTATDAVGGTTGTVTAVGPAGRTVGPFYGGGSLVADDRSGVAGVLTGGRFVRIR